MIRRSKNRRSRWNVPRAAVQVSEVVRDDARRLELPRDTRDTVYLKHPTLLIAFDCCCYQEQIYLLRTGKENGLRSHRVVTTSLHRPLH